jgi:aminoglycoside N3'-acetyltransferase
MYNRELYHEKLMKEKLGQVSHLLSQQSATDKGKKPEELAVEIAEQQKACIQINEMLEQELHEQEILGMKISSLNSLLLFLNRDFCKTTYF